MVIRKGVKDVVSYVYQSGDLNLEYFRANRAQYGTQAHQAVQKQYLDEECEVYLEQSVASGEHEVILSGRMDLLLKTTEGWIVGEIKSTLRNLDSIQENDRPTHYAQAKAYAYLLLCQHQELSEITVRLIYCDLDGVLQRHFDQVYTKEQLQPFMEETLEIYLQWYFILQKSRQLKLKTAKELAFPFGEFRAYQRELSGAVYRCVKEKKRLLLRAPTGIGKTMGTIFPSIKALSDTEQKIFYFTAKTLGRTVAEKAFKQCQSQGLCAKVTTLTAKEKICLMDEVKCDPSYCPYAKGYFDRINKATQDLFQAHQLFNYDRIVEYAKKHQVCPFEYSLGMASISDAVIGDYNYLFDPRAYLRRFFEEPSPHIALIDEAHNLYDRACEMFSATLTKEPIIKLKRLFKGRNQSLNKSLNALNSKFIEYRHELEESYQEEVFKEDLDSSFLLKVQNAMQVIEKYLYREIDANDRSLLINLYFDLLQFSRISEYYNESFRVRYEELGTDFKVSIICLDPSLHLSDQLQKVRSGILFSATLHPMDYYHTLLLNKQPCEKLFLPSPFDREHLSLIVQCSISTKYRDRQRSIAPILSQVYHLTQKKAGNYLIFFPSYHYLDQVYEAYVEMVGDEQEVLKQERQMSEELRGQFLETFTQNNSRTLVAFAVLGGVFSEGIDLIGDHLIGAIIIGVGLPQINPLTEQRKQYFEATFNEGYRYAYLYPGFNKVMQAVGRVIRTDEDRGTVLLIDNRYLQQDYLNLFPYEWQHATFKN